ncbi:hypothetical protein BLA29_009771, partial [Euroglyphus maynei]
VDILKQLDKLYCTLGQTTYKEEIEKLEKQSTNFDKMIENLKKLKTKMEHFRDEKMVEEKRENITKLNEELQRLDSSEKLSIIGNEQMMINEIELDFLLDEIAKNNQLITEMKSLTNELDGFIDLDQNELNEQWLDERIKYLERTYRSFFLATDE